MHEAAVYTNAHHAETVADACALLSVQPQDVASLGDRVTAGTVLTPQLNETAA